MPSRWPTKQTLASASQRCSVHTSESIGCWGFQWFFLPAGNCKSLSASAKYHFACLEKEWLSSYVQWTDSLAILEGNSQVEKKRNWSPKRDSLGKKKREKDPSLTPVNLRAKKKKKFFFCIETCVSEAIPKSCRWSLAYITDKGICTFYYPIYQVGAQNNDISCKWVHFQQMHVQICFRLHDNWVPVFGCSHYQMCDLRQLSKLFYICQIGLVQFAPTIFTQCRL